MSALRMPRVFTEVPRHRRAIVDADGMYNQIVSVDSYDRNYQWEQHRVEWFAHYADRRRQDLSANIHAARAGRAQAAVLRL